MRAIVKHGENVVQTVEEQKAFSCGTQMFWLVTIRVANEQMLESDCSLVCLAKNYL